MADQPLPQPGRKRSRIPARELTSLVDHSNATKGTPQCPLCRQRIPHRQWPAHYDYEMARLNDPSSDIYADPLDDTKGKRGAAVAARQHMQQNNGKRPRTVYEERLEVLQNNARQRTNVMKQLSNPQENPSSTLDQASFSQQGDQTCFICNQVLFGDSETINLHIDRCLASMGDEPSPAEPPALHTPQQVDSWDEYEWAGQVRVRASAMMEGGYKGAGFATARKEEDVEEDLDIEDDDNQYGHGQFTEADLIVDDTDDDLAVDDDDLPSTSASSFPPSGNLVVDALKSRVHQLEMATKSVPRCLICLEPYTKPVTSVICWHVHCEKCWLQTLGSKKLCPQCQKITTPGDLRRIYL